MDRIDPRTGQCPKYWPSADAPRQLDDDKLDVLAAQLGFRRTAVAAAVAEVADANDGSNGSDKDPSG